MSKNRSNVYVFIQISPESAIMFPVMNVNKMICYFIDRQHTEPRDFQLNDLNIILHDIYFISVSIYHSHLHYSHNHNFIKLSCGELNVKQIITYREVADLRYIITDYSPQRSSVLCQIMLGSADIFIKANWYIIRPYWLGCKFIFISPIGSLMNHFITS